MAGIKGKQLENAPDGITAGKINDSAVETAKINDLAVTTAKIDGLAVTTAKLANVSVTSGKIADGNVDTLQIAAGALSADAAGRAKMASGYFDATTASDKFGTGVIADTILGESYIKANGLRTFTADQPFGGFKATGLGAPTASGDAATKGYVDAIVQGLDIKESCRFATDAALPANTPMDGPGPGKRLLADANGALSVDGTAVGSGDRILVKDEGGGTSSHNGIYTVTATGDGSNPWELTRATDADEDAEVDTGMFVFIEEGTANASSGWVLTTAAPITVDTTALTFAQFSGAGQVTAGAGLLKTGNVLDVELATDPGLEFDAGGAAGKLRALVDPNGGLERVTAGLGLLLNGTSLDKGASGLKSAVPTTSNKDMTPAVTSGDGDSTTLTITAKNAGNGYVGVRVNGLDYQVGDGVKTKDCYFSADGGTTAKSFVTLAAADTLYWNGVIAGFDLAASDVVDFLYEVT